MGGRHAMSKESDTARKWQYGIGLLVIASILAGVFVLRDEEEPALADCSMTTEVSVAAAPEIADVVESAADRAAEKTCATYQVEASAPAVVAQALTLGDGAPDLWIPDSTQWVGRVQAQSVEGGPAPEIVAESVATSPVILAGPGGATRRPATWANATAAPGYVSGDALASSTALAPLLAAQAEAAQGITQAELVSGALVSLAQKQSAEEPETNPAKLADAAVRANGTAALSEQAYLTLPSASSMTAVVPQTGAVMLDYPVAVTSEQDAASDAGKALAKAMGSATGVEELTAAGFRTPSGDALPDGDGVGTFEPMVIDNAELVSDTVRNWSSLALPGNALAVIDVSGSMAAAVDDTTRMDLTVQWALSGLAQMPDSWHIGTWIFSTNLDGNKDYRELAPIRQLGSVQNGVTHRSVEEDVTRGITAVPGGGTGLYDTVLAAYRTVQANYNPRAVNSVILMTDGENDDPGSLSLSELLATLQRERDPARPVVVVANGMSADADEDALRKIASVTGGTSYVARDPAQVSEVFQEALESRG